MKWHRVFLFVLPFLCLGLGILGAWILESGRLHGWEALGAVPGGAGEFLDASTTYVYLKNRSGDIYRNPDSNYCETCWEKTLPLDKPLIDPSRSCQGTNSAIPSTPGEVVDRLAGRECYADAIADFEYVILTDGSVWKWAYFRGAYGLLVYPLFALCGCLAGIIPLGIWGLMRLVRRGKPPQAGA